MRSQLQRLGVMRESGHEYFTGSSVVPIFDEQGAVVEMYGRKLMTTAGRFSPSCAPVAPQHWAKGASERRVA